MGFKFKILVFLFIVFNISIILAPAAIEKNVANETCYLCHPLKDSHSSWQISSHSKINCVQCHGATNLKDFPNHSWEIYQNIAIHLKGKDYKATLHRSLENEVCEQCHTSNRPITPTGDLIIPHDKHRDRNVPCVRCHSSVGHGETVQLNMTECMQCHEKRKVSHDCTICHSNIQVPDSHLVQSWTNYHGKTAYGSVNNCARCHAYYDLLEGNLETPIDQNVFSELSQQSLSQPEYKATVKYAKGNPYCIDCHTKEPAFHYTGWLISHPLYSHEKGMRNCLTCHYLTDPKDSQKFTNLNCNKCHGFDPEANETLIR